MLPKNQVRKGLSLKSHPMEIKSVIGKWDYRLADGQIWNARRLIRYRPAYRPLLEIDFDELEMDSQQFGNPNQKVHTMKL